MKLPHKKLEQELFKKGYAYIYAVDEVGVGCLAGPVVACAVGITNTFYKKHHKKLSNLRESKLLSASQREKFARLLIEEKSLVYAVASCSPKIIDKLNIYHAARKAMRKSIEKIKPAINLKTIVLVDGNTKIKNLEMEQMPIVQGDRKIFAIACASIIAKVYRDKFMKRQAKKYPGYGFEKHMGYGTKYHQAQLTLLGPCPIHRRSFRLVYGESRVDN